MGPALLPAGEGSDRRKHLSYVADFTKNRLFPRRNTADRLKVERRIEPRYPANIQVSVTKLADPGIPVAGCITDVSNFGIQVRLDSPLATGEMVLVDTGDSHLWGQVMHCRACKDGFTVGLEMVKVLIGGGDVSQLLRGLLDSAVEDTDEIRVSR